jgi:hypothetical protein
MGQGAGDAAGVDSLRFFQISEGSFQGEGICVQPVKESGFAKDAGVRELTGVDVCI